MRTEFDKKMNASLKKLELFIPAVIRVHGTNHPEMNKVGKLFDDLKQKVANSDTPELENIFSQLREITNNYEVPNDVCESYEAVYQTLESADKMYEKAIINK